MNIIAPTLIAAAITAVSSHALAQDLPCAPHGVMMESLQDRFSEERIGYGVVDGAMALVEIYRAPSGTWTMVITDTNGKACIVGYGEDWTVARALEGDPA